MSDPELIDRLYDGDVDREQEQEARQRLAADPRAAARFERLQLIGSLVRELESERQLPTDFTDRVMAQVDPPRARRVSRLYPILAGATGSALALAAAAVLWLRGPVLPELPSAASAWTAPSYASPAGGTEALAMDAAEPPSVSIESVDFGATQGAIFLVSTGVTDTMVVWTLDEPDPTGRRR